VLRPGLLDPVTCHHLSLLGGRRTNVSRITRTMCERMRSAFHGVTPDIQCMKDNRSIRYDLTQRLVPVILGKDMNPIENEIVMPITIRQKTMLEDMGDNMCSIHPSGHIGIIQKIVCFIIRQTHHRNGHIH
jgi:hypothetical protein